MTENHPEHYENDENAINPDGNDEGTDRELRDEDTAADPNENNLDDLVRVDGPSKLAHEDTVPESQREIDSEAEFRDGHDLEGGKTARELRDERVDERNERADDNE